MPRIVSLNAVNLGESVKITATGNMGVTELTIPLSLREFDYGMQRWDAGELIQRAFPTLDAEQREFLMTGITPEQWKDSFGDEED